MPENSEIERVFNILKSELDGKYTDHPSRKHVYLGKLPGFDMFLHLGQLCLTYPELSREAAQALCLPNR